MSITLQLKRISIPMLKLIKQDPLILSLFFDAKWLPESPFWQRSKHWRGDSAEKTKQEARKRFTKSLKDCTGLKKVCNLQALESQLLAEWEMPELDLHKNFPELTYLLAGYVPGYVSSEWTIPEVKSMANQISTDFLPFLVIEKSEWDSLPLVNALGSGTEINFKMSYGNPRYLLMDEVGEILDGLLFLSEAGFQDRYKRESEKTNPIPQIDWEEEEMLDWMTDYFNEIQNYYEDTFRNKDAMLLYLT
jgi:Domain of unknown function (DUF1877)